MNLPSYVAKDLVTTVTKALEEDIGSGDITAQLIPETNTANAEIITREEAIVCGQAWVNEVFHQVDNEVIVTWKVTDGDRVFPNQVLFTLHGSARSLLTGERTALNFLQLLSGTATICRHYADIVAGTSLKLLDTRKTIPGLRTAQKYAVSCGGCYNHRIGLYDAFLIKENHIAACGGIKAAVATAKKNAPNKPIETEVENLHELKEALAAGVDIVMLDNFSLEHMREAVTIAKSQVKLEVSGNVTQDSLPDIAKTGVDLTSIGALTKNCRAVDLSMRFLKNTKNTT